MSGGAADAALTAHLAAGASDVARCWTLIRRDGVTLGFTDHDRDLAFDGITFRAETGLTAAALSQTTGLSVDNTEALGALSDAAISEAEIAAGRYDGARVEAWLVCWSNPKIRTLVFRGTLGEITRTGATFQAELRGLSEALNRPTGRVYHKNCSCAQASGRCGVDPENPAHIHEGALQFVDDSRIFLLDGMEAYALRWFDWGSFEVLTGAAAGLKGVIKNDRVEKTLRRIELWAPIDAAIVVGDRVRLTIGCADTIEDAIVKFGDAIDFRGFPDIPGDDWIVSHPARAWVLDGGSRR
ncbi:MAG: DUF2163 domain-containing protein [Pseudomonadota bacterium]